MKRFKLSLNLHGIASGASPNPAALLSKHANDACGNSSFVNKSSSGSPTVGDCNCIRNRALATPRSYLSYLRDAQQQGGWHRLTTCRTCVFGFKTSNAFGTIVGTSDIADLIRDSINRFQWNRRVGAEGKMGCGNGLETASTNWAIFHS